MFSGMTKRGKLGLIAVFALVICVAIFSLAEVLMPEAPGEKVQHMPARIGREGEYFALC